MERLRRDRNVDARNFVPGVQLIGLRRFFVQGIAAVDMKIFEVGADPVEEFNRACAVRWVRWRLCSGDPVRPMAAARRCENGLDRPSLSSGASLKCA